MFSGLRYGIALKCGVGHRHGLDLAVLGLWHRPAPTALIRPLAWEPPYAMGVALKRQKNKINKISILPKLIYRFMESQIISQEKK